MTTPFEATCRARGEPLAACYARPMLIDTLKAAAAEAMKSKDGVRTTVLRVALGEIHPAQARQVERGDACGCRGRRARHAAARERDPDCVLARRAHRRPDRR